jgi:hypothetical protein
VDEIGTEAEALACRSIAERGVQLVGTAHGQLLENLIKVLISWDRSFCSVHDLRKMTVFVRCCGGMRLQCCRGPGQHVPTHGSVELIGNTHFDVCRTRRCPTSLAASAPSPWVRMLDCNLTIVPAYSVALEHRVACASFTVRHC